MTERQRQRDREYPSASSKVMQQLRAKGRVWGGGYIASVLRPAGIGAASENK